MEMEDSQVEPQVERLLRDERTKRENWSRRIRQMEMEAEAKVMQAFYQQNQCGQAAEKSFPRPDVQREKKVVLQQTIAELQLRLERAQKDAEERAAEFEASEAKNETLRHELDEAKETLERDKQLNARAADINEAAVLVLQLQLLEKDVAEKEALFKAEELGEALTKEKEEREKAQKALEECLASKLAQRGRAERQLESRLLRWDEERAGLVEAKAEARKALEEREQEWADVQSSMKARIEELERDVSEVLEKKQQKKKRGWWRRLTARKEKEEEKMEMESSADKGSSRLLSFFKRRA